MVGNEALTGRISSPKRRGPKPQPANLALHPTAAGGRERGRG